MLWLIVLATIAILIFFNALYVAAEFSTVSSRRSRLAQLSEQGNRTADYLLPVVEDPRKLDTYVATCQVGITISSLVLGFYGQSQITGAISPLLAEFGGLSETFAASLSATLILTVLTVMQVLLGELVPKNVGVQFPESLAMLTALPMRWSSAAFRPLIWLLNGSGILIMRVLGLRPETEHTHVHSPDEIAMLVEESGAAGLLHQEERRLVKNTLRLREVLVRQVMVPRTRMLSASTDIEPHDLLHLLADSPFSRVPIYEETIDNIVGFVHLKDLVCLDRPSSPDALKAYLHPISFIPQTTPVREAFALLQRDRSQIAIVLDEFGGAAGMVTIEDLIEEIFGKLEDEFDAARPAMRVTDGQRVWIPGDTLVEEVNGRLGLELPEDEIITLGGLIQNVLGHVPEEGEQVKIDGHAFRVEKMSGIGILGVSLKTTPTQRRQFRKTHP